MKIKFLSFLFFVSLFLFSCAAGIPSKASDTKHPQIPVVSFDESQITQLDNYSCLERSGAWFQGMGFLESGLRESFGDYAGAVTASYKEIAWAYGVGLIQKEDVERALLSTMIENNNEAVHSAGYAVLAFSRGQWDIAAASIEQLPGGLDEPDSFQNWMLLVCALEKNNKDRRASSAYQAIRGRYSFFPDYWYRGARVLSGFAAAEYAERCIDFTSNGPYADECRLILAGYIGLQNEDAVHLRTKKEIESIISASLEKSDPYLLDPLLPLIALPDNPYTEYAIEMFKRLNNTALFKDYFTARRAGSNGRLSERLSLIIHS